MTDALNTPPEEPIPGVAPVAPHVESAQPDLAANQQDQQQTPRQQGELKTAPCTRCGDHYHPWKMKGMGGQLLCDACYARQKRDNRSRVGMYVAGGVFLAVIVAAFAIGWLRINAGRNSPEGSLQTASVIMSGTNNVDARHMYVNLDGLRAQAAESHMRVYGNDPISKPMNSFIDTRLWGTIFTEPDDVQIEGDVAICTFPKHLLMEEMPGTPIIIECRAFDHPERGRQWQLYSIVNIDQLTAALPEGTDSPSGMPGR